MRHPFSTLHFRHLTIFGSANISTGAPHPLQKIIGFSGDPNTLLKGDMFISFIGFSFADGDLEVFILRVGKRFKGMLGREVCTTGACSDFVLFECFTGDKSPSGETEKGL